MGKGNTTPRLNPEVTQYLKTGEVRKNQQDLRRSSQRGGRETRRARYPEAEAGHCFGKMDVKCC